MGVLVDGDSKPLSIKLINLTECQDGIVEAFSGLSLTAAAEHASLTTSGGISLPPELTRVVLEHLHAPRWRGCAGAAVIFGLQRRMIRCGCLIGGLLVEGST